MPRPLRRRPAPTPVPAEVAAQAAEVVVPVDRGAWAAARALLADWPAEDRLPPAEVRAAFDAAFPQYAKQSGHFGPFEKATLERRLDVSDERDLLAARDRDRARRSRTDEARLLAAARVPVEVDDDEDDEVVEVEVDDLAAPTTRREAARSRRTADHPATLPVSGFRPAPRKTRAAAVRMTPPPF